MMLREGLFTRPAEIGRRLEDGLNALAAKHEVIGEVRGRGLLRGVEFVADRASKKPFDRSIAFTQRLVSRMRDNNVIVAAGMPLANFGKDGDHIQISPPYTISESEIDLIVSALDDALTHMRLSL